MVGGRRERQAIPRQEDGGCPKTGRWWPQRPSALGSNSLCEKWRVLLGYKQTLKMIRQDKASLVILDIFPAWRKSEREYYAMLAHIGVHHHCGNNTELGTDDRKHYRVYTLAVMDSGDCGIIRSRTEQTGEE